MERFNTMSNTSLIIKYGDFTADFNSLPEASLVAMLRRGFARYMGSEQAAKVTGHFDPDADEPVTDSPEARAAFKAQCQAKAMEALAGGTVGVSTRGPAVDPITTIINRLAKAKVISILKANSIAVPKKAGDTVTLNGQAYTLADLIERRKAKFSDQLAKDAKKIADEQARRNKKSLEEAKEEGLAAL